MRCVEGKRLDNLLRSPCRGGMSSNVEMDHLTSIVSQDDEPKQDLKPNSAHGKEIDGDQLAEVPLDLDPQSPLAVVRWQS